MSSDQLDRIESMLEKIQSEIHYMKKDTELLRDILPMLTELAEDIDRIDKFIKQPLEE